MIWYIILGTAAGFLATKVLDRDLNVVATIAIGILGALLGGVLLKAVTFVGGLIGGLIGAVFGAILILYLYQRFFG